MRPPWWAVASATTGLVALIGGWLVAGAVAPPGYDAARQTISVLAADGHPHRWIMTTGLYAVGVGHLITAAGLRGARRIARAVLAVGGLAGIGLATLAQPQHGSSAAHLTCTTVGFVMLAVFPVLVGGARGARFPLRRRDSALGAAISVVLLVWLVLALHRDTPLGIAERVLTAEQTLWPLLAVLALRRRPSVPSPDMGHSSGHGPASLARTRDSSSR